MLMDYGTCHLHHHQIAHSFTEHIVNHCNCDEFYEAPSCIAAKGVIICAQPMRLGELARAEPD